MASSRTGTTKYLRNAAKIRAEALSTGITNCPVCGHPMDYRRGSRDPHRVTVDHRIPYAQMRRMGRLSEADDIENLRTRDGRPNVMCAQCNSRLGDKRHRVIIRPAKRVSTLVQW